LVDYSQWEILVVDDGEDDIELVGQVLRYHGIDVLTARDGNEALWLLRTVRPDLIITDLQMPDIDGWSVLATIRNNPDIAHIPVVTMTAYGSSHVERELIAAGFNAYIIKPIRTTKMLSVLGDILA